MLGFSDFKLIKCHIYILRAKNIDLDVEGIEKGANFSTALNDFLAILKGLKMI